MRVGIVVPQGWTGEYENLDGAAAWAQTVAVARAADQLGFESIWMFDHFHTTPEPTDTVTFEAYTALSALGALTENVRLGQLVTCAAYRNPALVAKMLSTLDSVTNGRAELGIGAGWKREEFEAYGYPFPNTRTRLRHLEEALEIISRMFAPGRATYEGEWVRVRGAINEPKPLQRPRPPILVGGNGREVTWRLAARYADELNVDAMPPEELPEAIEVLADRCIEAGRDPSTLPVSVHIWWEHLDAAPSRAELLDAYRRAGASRVMTLVRDSAQSVEALEAFRDDCIAAGAELRDTKSASPVPAALAGSAA